MEMIPMREAMQQRHSVRSYLSTPIPQDVLTTLRQAVKECSSAAKMRIQLVTDEPEAFCRRAQLHCVCWPKGRYA